MSSWPDVSQDTRSHTSSCNDEAALHNDMSYLLKWQKRKNPRDNISLARSVTREMLSVNDSIALIKHSSVIFDFPLYVFDFSEIILLAGGNFLK